MLDTIMGVPAHALIVHATVVLLPLAALGGIAIALVPALRRRFGVLVAPAAVAAVVLVPVTVASGERLFDRRQAQFGPGDDLEAGRMERHADLAQGLLPWVLLLAVGVLAVLAVPALARRATRRAAREPVPAGRGSAPDAHPAGGTPGWAKAAAAVAAVVTLAGGVMTVVQVVRIGHAGSEAAWTEAEPQE